MKVMYMHSLTTHFNIVVTHVCYHGYSKAFEPVFDDVIVSVLTAGTVDIVLEFRSGQTK